MKEPNIQQICDGLSVCVSCYEKVHRHLMGNRNNLCHICFTPCPNYDLVDLRWIGEKHVVCCGKDFCEEEIRLSDKIILALETPK